MPKFRYRMQNILDIKNKLESQAKIEYSMANQKYLEEQKKLQEIMLRRASYEKVLKESITGNIDVHEVMIARTNVNTMKSIMRTQMIEVHKAEMQLEDARKKLNDLMIDRKTHEKLKEKAFDEFKAELKLEENKEIDQLVSYEYSTKKE